MVERYKTFISAMLAGFLIGIGGSVYKICDNPYVGAFLFSIGLCFICFLKLDLFTGKVGFSSNFRDLSIIWCGNLIGTFFCATICYDLIPEIPNSYWNVGYLEIFLRSIMTGVLIYLAVYYYKNAEKHKLVGIFLCVPCFILCGFRHCVADMYYFWFSDSWENILKVLVATLGNSFGSIMFAFCYSYIK